jgi:hypothetical protein
MSDIIWLDSSERRDFLLAAFPNGDWLANRLLSVDAAACILVHQTDAEMGGRLSSNMKRDEYEARVLELRDQICLGGLVSKVIIYTGYSAVSLEHLEKWHLAQARREPKIARDEASVRRLLNLVNDSKTAAGPRTDELLPSLLVEEVRVWLDLVDGGKRVPDWLQGTMVRLRTRFAPSSDDAGIKVVPSDAELRRLKELEEHWVSAGLLKKGGGPS